MIPLCSANQTGVRTGSPFFRKVSITRYRSATRSAGFAVGASALAGWVVSRVSIRFFLDQFNILFVESKLNEFILCFGSVISVEDDSLVLDIAARAQRFL